MRERLAQLGRSVWVRMQDQRGLTTVEYIIGAGIILVVLAAAVMAWNNGLAAKINELVQQLMGTP
jgi:Flp pilus assembly pilin Flp